MKSEVIVIGAGPGGYVAAIRLGQLGKQVTLIEKQKLGGTCLQVGCIPSKALIGVAKQFEQLREAAKFGIQVSGEVTVDLGTTQKWKKSVLEQLTRGIQGLCKANKVNVLAGTARFTGPNQVVVATGSGEETVDFEKCIIATGSEPIAIPGFAFEGTKIISSSEALDFTQVPKRLTVIGGGYIGLELGSLYAKMGTAVTVVEMTPSLLPGFDPDAVDVVAKRLRKNKVDILVETRALGYEAKGGNLTVSLDRKGEKIALDADIVLVTVGRRPITKGFDLEKSGVTVNAQGFIAVNKSLQTNVPHIYAIGDVAGQPMLAHKASKEAEVAAEHIAGHNAIFDAKAVPAVVFTDPEIATVGMSEADARKAGHEVAIGKFPFVASSKAMISGHTDGFVKLIADRGSRGLLGALVVGNEAGTMIAEATALIEMGASIDDLAMIIHAHPTVSEAYAEAALAASGRAIHVVNR